GGIYVEVLKDVTFRIAPFGEMDASTMLREIRAAHLLDGVRGQKPTDKEALTDALQRISQLVTDFPEIAELDINPLFVYEKGRGGGEPARGTGWLRFKPQAIRSVGRRYFARAGRSAHADQRRLRAERLQFPRCQAGYVASPSLGPGQASGAGCVVRSDGRRVGYASACA
ncbi:hypothetical protein FBQ96_08480, partial [Nitrospirales bacterium NOB]|nr:hypothetical protein [Nitrospirales bacterium NOB]